MVWPTADIPTYGRGVWLECNGQSFSTTQFPQLYQTLGTNRVPDYQGMFLRGYGTSDDFRIENVNGDGANTSVSSGDIGEIQPMADLPFFMYTPAMYVSWASDWNFVELQTGKFAGHRAWTYKNSTYEVDSTFPSFFISDSYNGEYPWSFGTEHFVPTHPKHYKYTISCSGGGGDGEEGGGGASCELNEERVDFELEEGIYLPESGYGHLYLTNVYSSPTTTEDFDLRPANIAVKFMIKAK